MEWQVSVKQRDGKFRTGSITLVNAVPGGVARHIVDEMHLNVGDTARFARVRWDYPTENFVVVEYSIVNIEADKITCVNNGTGTEFFATR